MEYTRIRPDEYPLQASKPDSDDTRMNNGHVRYGTPCDYPTCNLRICNVLVLSFSFPYHDNGIYIGPKERRFHDSR